MELEFLSREKGQPSLKKILKNRFTNGVKTLSFGKVLYYIFIFFISAANFPLWSPSFGCAVFASQFSAQLPLLTAVLILIAGVAVRVSALQLLKTVLSIFLFSVAATKFGVKSPVKKGAIMASSVLFCSIVPKIFSTLFLYDAVFILLEALIVFVCTVLFCRAKDVIFTLRDTPLSSEELASVAVFFAVTVMGISRFEFMEINMSAFFCSLAALIFAFQNGIGAGAVSGILMGLVFGISSGDIAYSVFSISLASMLSGFFSRYGKASSAISFLLAICVATFFSSATATAFINLSQMSVAVIIFIFLPQKFISFFDITAEDTEHYDTRLKKYISGSFMTEAETIKEIADTFSSLCHSPLESESAATSFFERTTHRLCGDCPKKNYCWRNEFHRTYTSFFVLLEICNKKGHITFSDIPDDLVKKCDRTGAFVNAFNSMYELYKVDRLWECRILESRCMVAKQLECISENLRSRAEDTLLPVYFYRDAEEEIIRLSKLQGIEISDISVTSENKVMATTSSHCKQTENLISKVMGEKYKCTKVSENAAVFSAFPETDISFSAMQKPKSGNTKCGDSGLCSYLDGGKFMMVLSDGMGSGEKARRDSLATADLSKKLLQGGFEATAAAEIINSALLLKSSETAFASLDMAVIDLFKGEANFYKMGAAPAFIKRGNSVKTIYAATLPAGTFSKSDIGFVSQEVLVGDAIILVSDGIANGENTDEIEKIISEYEGDNAEEFANIILNYASGGEITDDMTVMVAFIV